MWTALLLLGNKLLDFGLLIGPLIVEWFKQKRAEGESASEYVKRRQAEQLALAKAMLDKDGQELTKLSRARLLLTRELLKRVRELPQPSTGKPDLLPDGTSMSGNSESDLHVQDAGRGKD